MNQFHLAVDNPKERPFMATILDDLSLKEPKLDYAEWLIEQGERRRGEYLRAFETARVDCNEWPDSDGISEHWKRMIGATLCEQLHEAGLSDKEETLLKSAIPIISLETNEVLSDNDDDDERRREPATSRFGLGASRIGGCPDLPPEIGWPRCAPNEHDEEGGDLALLAQINFAEIAGMQAANNFPQQGLLSFSLFHFDGVESYGHIDDTHQVHYIEDVDQVLRWQTNPLLLDEDRNFFRPYSISFSEGLLLPTAASGYGWNSEQEERYARIRTSVAAREPDGAVPELSFLSSYEVRVTGSYGLPVGQVPLGVFAPDDDYFFCWHDGCDLVWTLTPSELRRGDFSAAGVSLFQGV